MEAGPERKILDALPVDDKLPLSTLTSPERRP